MSDKLPEIVAELQEEVAELQRMVGELAVTMAIQATAGSHLAEGCMVMSNQIRELRRTKQS